MHFGRLLGEGGFAKTVAIKRLHRQLARDPKFRESILEEGRLAARIRHPNVVPPLDVLSEANELLLVMEYVHGESLSKLLRVAWANDEVVPLAVGAAVMANTLHGLHAAHEAKDEKGRPLDIVHRDVSPQNVLVGVDGVARVIDFGIAKAVTTQGESTSTGVIKGKVPYLAPEQLEGEPATRRTDVYAASVCLWEVLAGHRLFQGEDDGEILRKILGMRVEPPSAYNPSVPQAVDDIVLRGLARKPDVRFATAREMALAIEELVHPATASVVGAWCERLAVTALANRAAQLAVVEASDKVGASSRPPPPPPVSQRPPPLSKRPPPPPSPPRPPPAPSGYEPAHASMTFGSQTVSAPAAQLSQMPDSQRGSAMPPPPMPRSSSGAPSAPLAPTMLALDEPIAPPPSTNRGTPRPPPAGALRKPAVEIPNVEWLPQQDPPKRGPLRIGRVLGILFALGLVVLLACLPMIARSLLLSGAQERGIQLELGRVELTRRSIKLVDVRVRANDLPGVVLSAPAMDVELSRLQPSRIAFGDVTVELEGTYAEVTRRVADFRAKRESHAFGWASDVQGLSVASGRIEWRNALGPGTLALLENVTIDADRSPGRALGEDYRLTAPLVTLRSGQTSAGPWNLDVQQRPRGSTSTLKLDPSGTYPATVTWVATELDAYTVTFAIPRLALSNLRLPATLFGPQTTGATKIELRGEVNLQPRTTPNRPLTGRVSAVATEIAVFPAAPPVDVTVDLPISGDGTKPIALDKGTLSISTADGAAQHAAAKLLGSLDVTASRLALDIGGKSTPLACSGKGETRIDARITLIADRIGDTRLGVDANPVCTPKVLSAK